MKNFNALSYSKRCDGDVCLVDSATTHTILRDKKYFTHLKIAKANVNTISGTSKLIEGSGRATIILPGGTNIYIESALYSVKSRRNLLSFKDLRLNGFHIETMNEGNKEYLYITYINSCQKHVVEKLPAFSSGLYYTTISAVESNYINQKFNNQKLFMLWHDRLGHPGTTMMRRIIGNTFGHPLKDQKILPQSDCPCVACSQGKLVIKPSMVKVVGESPMFLHRIQGDICGPIHPPCGPFRYFMVLIDASSKWSHVCLLSTRSNAFAKLLAQIIKLRAHFPDYPIKAIRLDNAGEFTSQAFDDYCMSIGINVEHPVAHTHTQNGLAENFIKRLQMIARPLIFRSQLPTSIWGHAILHAASLVRIRPSSIHQYSPLQLVFGQQPNISHLKIFGCAVYVSISPPQRTKMGHQRRLGIYIGFDSPSIIRYLEPSTGDMFLARFADCHFNETVFPPLGGGKLPILEERREITWNVPSLSHLDPHTNQSEHEVQRIIHLQNIANQLPDAFTDTKKVIKSYIPAVNTPARIDIPEGQHDNTSKARLKRGRPVGAKDKNPRKKKTLVHIPEEQKTIKQMSAPEETITDQFKVDKNTAPVAAYAPEDIHYEISLNYMSTGESWNRKEVIIDNIFAYKVAIDIAKDNEDPEPKTVEECRHRKDWPKWKDAIQAALD